MGGVPHQGTPLVSGKAAARDNALNDHYGCPRVQWLQMHPNGAMFLAKMSLASFNITFQASFVFSLPRTLTGPPNQPQCACSPGFYDSYSRCHNALRMLRSAQPSNGDRFSYEWHPNISWTSSLEETFSEATEFAVNTKVLKYTSGSNKPDRQTNRQTDTAACSCRQLILPEQCSHKLVVHRKKWVAHTKRTMFLRTLAASNDHGRQPRQTRVEHIKRKEQRNTRLLLQFHALSYAQSRPLCVFLAASDKRTATSPALPIRFPPR